MRAQVEFIAYGSIPSRTSNKLLLSVIIKKLNMNLIKKILKTIIPFYSAYVKSASTPVHNQSYWSYIRFRLIGYCNGGGYYPVHPTCTIANQRKVFVGCNATVARPGCYIQGAGKVYFGNYVQLGPNVGILSSNHDLYDQRKNIMKHQL